MDQPRNYRIKKEKSITQLSTGVEIGVWAYPAGKSLPPLNLTTEELVQLILKNKDKIEEMFLKIRTKNDKG